MSVTLTFRHTSPEIFTTPPGERRPNPFSTGYDKTLRDLAYELDQLDATEAFAQVVLAGPAQIRQDGMLRSRAEVLHPGCALTVVTRQHGTLVWAVDAFAGRYTNDPPDWQINLRAIVLGMHDLRRLDRYGMATRGQQYAGFRAIGAGTPLGSTAGQQTDEQVAHFLATQAGIDHLDPTDRDAVRAAYRKAAQIHHPDHGGSHAMMGYLTTARDHLLPEG